MYDDYVNFKESEIVETQMIESLKNESDERKFFCEMKGDSGGYYYSPLLFQDEIDQYIDSQKYAKMIGIHERDNT